MLAQEILKVLALGMTEKEKVEKNTKAMHR
jgi:hypothetical protein